MIRLLAYIGGDGVKPFENWFVNLDIVARAKVVIALARLEQGNSSNVKGVGAGVQEYKIDFGPGYRIYFGRDGVEVVILLGGGSKKRQSSDIAAAKSRWTDYKRRKKSEGTSSYGLDIRL